MAVQQQQIGVLSYGYLRSATEILTLIGAPVVGITCDRYGFRIGMALTGFGCATSYVMLGLSPNIAMIYGSQIPMSLQHGFQAAQVAISLLSVKNERVCFVFNEIIFHILSYLG